MTRADRHAVFLSALRGLLGDHAVLTPQSHDAPTLAPYLDDWRGRYQGQALAIALPQNTQEVSEVVKLCAAHHISVVPQGGNTSLVGGSIPREQGDQLVLSLKKLNQVISIDPDNLSMAAQAGCTLARVQEAAEQAGLLFPLSLASQGSCTIGGNLATNAGGTQVLRYGTARELCLGLEMVTAQGDVLNSLTSLRKDNSGYALRDLVIGSEGTLAIITAATLKLFPRPAGQATALVTCPSIESCLTILRTARQHLDAELTGFEVIQEHALRLLQTHLPDQIKVMSELLGPGLDLPAWTILLETVHSESDSSAQLRLESLLSRAIEQGWATNGLVAQNTRQSQSMWALRESIPLAERREGIMVKHDIGVPTSAIPALLSRCEKVLCEHFPGCRIVCFGHLGDGNLHYNVQAPAGCSMKQFVSDHESLINECVYDAASQLGGTISAEHGIGQLKRDQLSRRKSPVAMTMMKAIKNALDPEGILNPNRLI